jgi:hypothetical protein
MFITIYSFYIKSIIRFDKTIIPSFALEVNTFIKLFSVYFRTKRGAQGSSFLEDYSSSHGSTRGYESQKDPASDG